MRARTHQHATGFQGNRLREEEIKESNNLFRLISMIGGDLCIPSYGGGEKRGFIVISGSEGMKEATLGGSNQQIVEGYEGEDATWRWMERRQQQKLQRLWWITALQCK